MSSDDPVHRLKDKILSSNENVNPKAVLVSVGINSALSLATVIAFSILRPRNRIVYERKSKYYAGDKQPPHIDPGFFSWLRPLIQTKEPELVEKIGPDAAVFLRFLRLMRWLFTVLALLAIAITWPIDISYNIRHHPPTKTALTMLTIQDVRGDSLFVHVGATYLFTFVVMIFCWYHWRGVIRLRRQWFRSDEYAKALYARTLMIQRVPKRYRTDEDLQSLFETGYPITAVHIGRRVGNLPKLIERHNQAVRELEQYLVMYLKDGQIGNKRPTIRKAGKKVDAIDYWTAQVKAAEEAVEKARSEIDSRKAENYGFVSMGTVPYAHIVAKAYEGKPQEGAEISLAPNPKDIIWKNVVISEKPHSFRKLIGFSLLCLVCAFYTIPLSIISFLANLSLVQAWVPALQNWASKSPGTLALVSGVLPPAISAFFEYLLPKIMRRLAKYQGAPTHARLDRAVVARYFGFLVVSQLFIFTLIGVLYQSISLVVLEIGGHKSAKDIFGNLNKIPGEIQNTYIQQSSYWLTVFPLRGFLVLFDLAQLLDVIWFSIKKRLFGRTPRDMQEWTKPPLFEYAIYYSNMLFMAAVALVYTPLAPLVPLLAAIVFWFSSIVYKYQLMFVFTTKVESGGRLWNTIVNRVLASTVFMQLLMVLTIGLTHHWRSYLWTSMIPPIIIILIFKVWLTKTFMKDFRYYIPGDEEIAASKVYTEAGDARSNRLSRRFGHPALHTELYTPMVHANMVPLLPQAYHGRLSEDVAGLGQHGGEKASGANEAVTLEGLKIAGIAENQLEYDPRLYQRDAGEADWETASVASTDILRSPTDIPPSPSAIKGEPSAVLTGYDAYLQRGPSMHADHIDVVTRLEYDQTNDLSPLSALTSDGEKDLLPSPQQ